MKKIALTLAAAAGVVALSAGSASAATPVEATANALGQARDDSFDQLQRAIDQMDQASNAGEKAAALDSQQNALSMAQAAAKVMKDASSSYGQG
jgi:hypothetical protein